jgi:hypothetical protein
MIPEYLQEVYNIIYKAKSFGYRKLDNKTELIGHVPHVAPQAWLHKIFAPLQEKEIDFLESEMKVDIPPVLEVFYFFNNGLGLFSSSLSFYGLRTSYERTGDAVWQPFDIILPNTFGRADDSSMNQLYIGSYDYDGSRLYIDNLTMKVYRCSRESSKPLNEWPSFEEMLLSETRRLDNLFDVEGKMKDAMQPTIPS